MYKWYAESAATVVFLADVAHPAKFGDLSRSVWMTRAWTLQELLAPKVILFYDSRWRRYLGDIGANHKRSRRIMQELADAIKIPLETIVSFSPDDLGVHEKLRLASTRIASVGEDVVYSLIGIFKSDIRPYYGEGQADALGHLLEEIVNRSGEVTVLTWSGKSSSYNSCLPASISAYSQTTYGPPSLEGKEMQMCITELRSRMAQQEALSIYKQVKSLPLARFASRRLQLPCIVFPVRGLSKRRGSENLYRAEVSGLGNVEFTTTDNLLKGKRQKIVFAHPWIHRILGRSSGVACHWAGDLDFDADSESDDNTSLDEVLSSYTVSTLGVDRYIPALRMVARLGQPFSALLLVQQPNGGFKRVSTKNEIVVSGLGANVTSKTIRPKVLEIL